MNGNTPSRLAPAGSAVIAGAVLALPAGMPTIVRIPAALALLGVLPVLVLWRIAGGHARGERPASNVLWALAAGMPLVLAIGAAASVRPWPLVPLVSVLSAALALLAAIPWPPRSEATPDSSGDAGAGLLAALVGLLCATPLAVDPATRVFGDAMFHGQIANEIMAHGWPPQDPSFAGLPLAYAWPLHAWVAAVARLARVTPYELSPWLAFAAGTTLTLASLQIAWCCGLERARARLAALTLLFAMNALGAWQATLRYAIAPLVGHSTGDPGLAGWWQLLFDRPDAAQVTAALVFRGHYTLSSLLYKLVCINTLSAALVLAVAAYAATLMVLRGGGRRWLLGVAAASAAAALAHPVVGMVAIVALASGLVLACAVRSPRRHALQALLATAAGAAFALPPLVSMLATPLAGGQHVVLRPFGANVPALVQGLAVSLPLSLFGLRRAWGDDPRRVALAAGYLLAAGGVSVLARFPSDAFAYPVYLAYLGSAWLLPDGLAELARHGERQRWLALTQRAAWAVLPLTTLLVVHAFARHDARWGLAGWPESADERAVFDALRRSEPDARVIDTQNFQMSAAAAYAGRRSVFGGMTQVGLVGYPRGPMQAREHAIRALLYAPVTPERDWATLDSLGSPLYVVARRHPSLGRVFDEFEQPASDPIDKLDTLPERLQPVLRTPSIALYRYRAWSGVTPPASPPR